jgi:Family of unknown function (DUF695)
MIRKFLLILVSLIFGAQKLNAQETFWTVKKLTYENYPLIVRYPTNLNYDELQKNLPTRLVVTLNLEKITDLGLPEPKYNDSLESFDIYLVDYFKEIIEGQCVLIETFSGNRNYYFYVSEKVDMERFKTNIKIKFPLQNLEFGIKNDPNWWLIRQYNKDYLQNN